MPIFSPCSPQASSTSPWMRDLPPMTSQPLCRSSKERAASSPPGMASKPRAAAISSPLPAPSFTPLHWRSCDSVEAWILAFDESVECRPELFSDLVPFHQNFVPRIVDDDRDDARLLLG